MLYRTAERMYNIYYLMRRRGSSPSSRVDAAVRFMVGFYAPGELAMLTKQIAIEGAGLVPEMREDHHRAFRFLFERAPDNAQRAAMLSSAPSEFIESSGIPESLEQLRSVISGKADRESPSPQGQAGPSRGWFARLQDLAANGDPRASAQKVLAEIAEADDESLEALVIMGPCLASLDRNEEAEQVYRKLITLAPDSDRAWGMFGVLLHEKLDRPEEAEAAYRKAIAFGPDFVEPRLALGRLLHELGRPEEAEAACRKAIDLAPEVARTWAQLGWLLHDKLDRYEEAEAAYRKAIDLAPDLAQTWAALGWLLHERLDRYEEAEEAYRKAIDLAPEFAQTWAQLGWLLHERLDRYEEAEAAYRKAIDLAPESPQVSLQLGWLLHQKLDRYEEAEAAYSRAIDLSPALVQARLLLGSLLHDKLDRYEEAEAAYRKAIALSPDSAPGWVVLGTLLDEKLDRYEEAEAAYRKAIQLGVETAPLWTQLGRLLHEKLDCLGDAEVAYRRAIEIKPSWDEAWTGLYSLVVGQPGRGAEAIEITEQAFTTLGRTAANLNRFAWVHRLSDSLDDVARGIAWAREAIGSSETDSERLHATGTLASLLCRSGEVDEALELAARWLDGMDETPIVDLTDLIVSLAAAGPVEPVLTMLRDSRHAERAEPLVVALEMFGGVETRAPTEIVQVGEDIVERIRKEQAGLPSLKKA
jgi:tetratricopeptide (TPR) repeat protein